MIETEVTTKQMMQTFKQSENPSADVCAVILKVNNKKFNTSVKSYNIKLFGKTMTEWVANSVYDATIRYAEVDFNDDFLPAVKRVCDAGCKYTFVLFSDTPLFERKNYLQILDYFKTKNLSVLKLTRGYVFETEYLTKIDSLLSPQTQYFEEDFMTCYNLKQTSIIADVLKNRILTYFMNNGVLINDVTGVSVDADCQIDADCCLHTNVQINGDTILENNVQVLSNSTITNSVICQNSKICGCVIQNSFVGKNCVIGYNSIICNNAKIEDGVVVPPNVVIDGVVVTKNDNLQSFKVYKK